jgi:hypothetical protein
VHTLFSHLSLLHWASLEHASVAFLDACELLKRKCSPTRANEAVATDQWFHEMAVAVYPLANVHGSDVDPLTVHFPSFLQKPLKHLESDVQSKPLSVFA